MAIQAPQLIGDEEKQPSGSSLTSNQQPGQSSALVQQPQSTTPKGSGFTNLQQYLGANQNNQLGQAVSGTVQQAGQQASNTLQAGQQQFQQGIGQAQNALQGYQQNVQPTLNEFQNPNYTASDIGQQQIGNFQALQNAQYAGPTGLGNQQQIQSQAQQAQQYGQMAGTQAGRQQLLQATVGNQPGYTQGAQTLDQALLSLGGGQQQLQQAAIGANQAAAQANQGVNAATLQGQAQANALQNYQQSVFNPLNTTGTGAPTGQLAQLYTNIYGNPNATTTNPNASNTILAQQAAAQTNAANQAGIINQYQGYMSAGNIPQATQYAVQNGLMDQNQANALNLLASTGGGQIQGYIANQNNPTGSNVQIPTAELGSLYTPGTVGTGLGDVANAAQQGQINALAQLSGGTLATPTWTTNAVPSNFNASGIASVANTEIPQYQQNISAILNPLNSMLNAYNLNNQLSNTPFNVNNLQSLQNAQNIANQYEGGQNAAVSGVLGGAIGQAIPVITKDEANLAALQQLIASGGVVS
jgi:hypothetical protein